MAGPDICEHVLFVSPGTHLPTLLGSALRDIGAVTHVVVLAEGPLVTDRTGETTQERAAKVAIRTGITRAHDLALSLGIPADHRTLDPLTIDSVCTAIRDIAVLHPKARFSFVVAGGSAQSALGIFRMAAWLEGAVYAASPKAVLSRLTVPKMSAGELSANPNYEAVLTLLHKKPVVPGNVSGVPRDELFRAMDGTYVPVRMREGRSNRPQITQGNFSQIMATLTGWGLVAEQEAPGNSRSRVYAITPDGELALSLFFAPPL